MVLKKISIALNWPVNEPGVAQVFQMLDPIKAKDIERYRTHI